MNYSKSVDLAYLPDIQKNMMDECNLNELNAAYQFANKHKFRSFCTYLNLISSIESKNYITKLAPVIDFPNGNSRSAQKVFDAGRAFEVCKVSSSSEIDVVLNSDVDYALEDFYALDSANVGDKIGIKVIINLGFRSEIDIEYILDRIEHFNIKYIKTNTGKEGSIAFEKKLKLVEWLRTKTKKPIKISGGVEKDQIQKYLQVAGPDTIFGISWSKLKEWDEFK